MSLPIVHLPVLQNWDCHIEGSCCKEYLVTVSDEERSRIEAQGWDKEKDLGGLEPFRRSGPPWDRKYHLNHQADGSCVFLSKEGRCRIHEKHGYETKPLPCRLFPFVLVPQGDRWGVSLRFACPSAASNRGRPLAQHDAEIHEFAEMLAKREGLKPQPDGNLVPPPLLQTGQRLDWADTRRFVQALLRLLRDRRERFEKRMRSALSFASLCRQAKYDQIKGHRLEELLQLLTASAQAETPVDPAKVPAPTWIGRILFRQALALYTRKDHGPASGLARRGRIALFRAALRFVRARGPVPRLHEWLPEQTFEQIEQTALVMTPAAEELLERYYTIKVGSMQFCGATSFGMSLWEGFEHLALTLPVLLWVMRAFAPQPAEFGLTKALSIVDDHFGFNRVLGSLRQRYGFHLLARRDEITRLIAWYAR